MLVKQLPDQESNGEESDYWDLLGGVFYIVFLLTINTIKPIVNFKYLLNVFIAHR